MKTFYIIKTIFPFLFLPIAPGVVQVELQRQGIIAAGGSAFAAVLMQIILTIAIIFWLAHLAHRKNETKSFLKMSCVSKKVFFQGQWMTVEKYLADYHNIMVSHGMTPEESIEWLNEAQAWVDSQVDAQTEAELEPYLK